MEVINFRFILADTGSWMNNTYCIEPYMSLYIDVGRVWELSFAKQLCEDACVKSQDCLSADLYHRPPTQWNSEAMLHACHLTGKVCNEERLVTDDIRYHHYKKGKLMGNYLNGDF